MSTVWRAVWPVNVAVADQRCGAESVEFVQRAATNTVKLTCKALIHPKN